MLIYYLVWTCFTPVGMSVDHIQFNSLGACKNAKNDIFFHTKDAGERCKSYCVKK